VRLHLLLQLLSRWLVEQVHRLMRLLPLFQQPSCWLFRVDKLDHHVVNDTLRPDAFVGGQSLISAGLKGVGRSSSRFQSVRVHNTHLLSVESQTHLNRLPLSAMTLHDGGLSEPPQSRQWGFLLQLPAHLGFRSTNPFSRIAHLENTRTSNDFYIGPVL